MIKNMMNNRAQMTMGDTDPNSVNDALQVNQNQGGTDRNFTQFQNISGAGTLPINPVYSETAKYNQLGETSEVDPSNGQNIQMT